MYYVGFIPRRTNRRQLAILAGQVREAPARVLALGQGNAPATMTRGGVAVRYAGPTPARSWSFHIGTSFIFRSSFANDLNPSAVSLDATAV